MKSTGIVRKVDELGRIVLPIELRRTLDIEKKDSMEIYIEGDTVILRKYQPACVFCDSAKDIVSFRGRNVCSALFLRGGTWYKGGTFSLESAPPLVKRNPSKQGLCHKIFISVF